MGNWHSCDTTHCWAGWITHLAGEAGKQLEKTTDTAFAAQLILRESSEHKVGVNFFYVDGPTALAEMKRLAELEQATIAA